MLLAIDERRNEYFKDKERTPAAERTFNNSYWGYKGNEATGLGTLAIIPAPWHLSIGPLRLFINNVLSLAVLTKKYESYEQFWKGHSVIITVKYGTFHTIKRFEGRVIKKLTEFMTDSIIKCFEPLTADILKEAWESVHTLMKLIYSKTVSPEEFSIEALCTARVLTAAFGKSSATVILRTLVDNVPYYIWKYGPISCFSEEALESYHIVTKVWALFKGLRFVNYITVNYL